MVRCDQFFVNLCRYVSVPQESQKGGEGGGGEGRFYLRGGANSRNYGILRLRQHDLLMFNNCILYLLLL